MRDPHRVDAAAGRFRAFFAELNDTFFERRDVLHQIALALLSKEHALVTGPPGTAKSALASAVFGRIVCERTGEPSIYQRQLTESTVQTDLIGPIDFKNLMETGRTSHFTDEGMLGAVHAFLDEVFDGRDMLLRSALNVLQERELKLGNRVTRGRVEVALMTTNRYIADVLEQARETLLAFVDRIAFVGFVPRGFADPNHLAAVLGRHVARADRGRLDALLTIQDVDVLQELVESVVVSPPMCEALAQLLSRLDAELNAAVRADAQFVPTRYLSTRTAVRSGRVLRAICVYRRIFDDPTRELQVLPDDLKWLRLHLLLSGPRPEEISQLLEREVDPHERRQLEIVRTERELFERCLARLPRIEVPPLPATPEAAPSAVPSATPSAAPAEPEAKAAPSPFAAHAEALASNDVSSIMTSVRALAAAAAGGADPAEAQRWLAHAVERLHAQVMQAALEAGVAASPPLDTIAQLVALIDTVDDDTVSQQELADWLRARARALIHDVGHFALGARSDDLTPGDRQAAEARVQRRLEVLRRSGELYRRAAGPAAPPERDDPAWRALIDAAEDDIAALWDAAFCEAAQPLLSRDHGAPLSEVLAAIEGELAWLDDIAGRVGALRGGPTTLKAKAIGARLTDLVGQLMRRIDEADRDRLHEEIASVQSMLNGAKLADTIAPGKWMLWATEALVRSGRHTAAAESEPERCDYDGYRALRAGEHRTPIAYTLGEVALRVAPGRPDLAAVAALVSELPRELQAEAAAIDLMRIERATRYLETWWSELCAGEATPAARLERVVKSRFFDVVWDESALARFALEAQLVGEILPGDGERAQLLRGRLVALEAATRRGAHALLRSRTDEAWRAAIGTGA